MRPVKIELEGFSAYRSHQTIQFSDVDFFSLSGPTGSGKSSLVDGMIFALYGRIPRLGGREVAPVISAGADRARVAVDFALGDTVYTAVRLVQRTKTGATTPEARLYRGDEPLASGADEVTKAVEDLLRLRFDDFVKTVVLPQGEFARFLTAAKSERQALLRKLLDLDVYGEVRSLAKGREAAASGEAAQARTRLDSLDEPDPETAAAAFERLAELSELAAVIVDRESDLDRLRTEAESAIATVTTLERAVDRLEAVTPPADLERLRDMVDRAQATHDRLEERQAVIARELEDAQSAHDRLPPAPAIEAHRRAYDRLAELDARLAESDLDVQATRSSRAQEAFDRAAHAHQQAAKKLTEARVGHSAHVLRATLAEGERCPVCLQTVETLPPSAPEPGLARFQQDEEDAAAEMAAARTALEEAKTALSVLEAGRQELLEHRRSLEQDLEGAPAPHELELAADEVERTKALVAESRRRLEAGAAELDNARAELERTAEALRSVGRHLTAARDKVADLGPPLPESDDPFIQWKELLAWTVEAREEVEARLLDARTVAAEAAQRAAEAAAALVADLERVGVEAVAPFAVQVTRLEEQARQIVEANEAAIRQGSELRSIIETSEATAAVAHTLANHLRADGFERWLMVEALTDLVAGANSLLSQLSGGGYSLRSDEEGTFAVVDHRNAGEVRPVSTLSGGETFLVSLALALSLAETLAASGGAGLDAIFLDEGFGTLDEDSLETVASVLEDLTGRGLMVGIITHVKELAVRAPVRFEVRREPSGSKVSVMS